MKYAESISVKEMAIQEPVGDVTMGMTKKSEIGLNYIDESCEDCYVDHKPKCYFCGGRGSVRIYFISGTNADRILDLAEEICSRKWSHEAYWKQAQEIISILTGGEDE